MIIAEQKPLEEILRYLENYDKIALASCGACVTVCMAGGEKETEELAAVLELTRAAQGRPLRVTLCSAERQCDTEFLAELPRRLNGVQAVLSLACGAGAQLMSDIMRGVPVLPGLNTRFMGVTRDVGVWTEMCQGCGDCMLERTGGICPVTRCSKSSFNGPCGGSCGGQCEISPEVTCGWQLIYDRLKELGRLDQLEEIVAPRDWSRSRDGGPRTQQKREANV